MQAQLNNLLGLYRTNSSVSIHSITSFAGSANTNKAYKEFCQNLFQIGVTADMVRQKKSEILNIFKPQNIAISRQIDDSNIVNEGHIPPVSSYSSVETYLYFIY